ncbi:ABC transporter permease [Methylococcus capsulatus]|uniref:ABC transporter permease n=1 Tax=Methylococcus capsulatus TaxID=414 RepID=UPI001C531B65|nr:ABC transporter permease [Methylococcus capsulatus]QXP87271.1 ABC transporter permease [Methylococcus capsulatus]QXP91376.1 ABC transporter permease [Methylococcus capsulatus]QXP92988.1 ABC transporter permease [Methylococcus capsulatus]UQN12268.1 ABC transporter permease [Methylococcus capsulatus]
MTYRVALQTILFKEIYRFLRIWPQTVLPPAVTTGLYFLIFGTVVGARIGEMGGFSYIDYIVPGVVLMSVITNSYMNVVSSFYSTKFQHNIEELLVAPVPDGVILAGYVGGGVMRGLVVGGVVLAISALFADFHPVHPWAVAAMLVLTATLFSLAGFLNAIFANSFDDISIVPNFVLTPLVYLGGVFYSIELLPDFWREVSRFNPILHMVNAFRYGFLGISDVPVELAFAMVGILILVLTLAALILLRRGTGLKT